MSGQLPIVGPPDEQVLRASLRDAAAFGAVFERHHPVIWRFLTYEEIAAALAVPIGTVRSRLARARRRLRDAMELGDMTDGLSLEATPPGDDPGSRGRT